MQARSFSLFVLALTLVGSSGCHRRDDEGREQRLSRTLTGQEPLYLPGGGRQVDIDGGTEDAGAVSTTTTTSAEMDAGASSATEVPITPVPPLASVPPKEPPGEGQLSIVPAPPYADAGAATSAPTIPPPGLLPGAPSPPTYEPYTKPPRVGPPSAADRNPWTGAQ
jgi:hypothetical protein